MKKDIYVVSALRTPFAKFQGELKDVAAPHLGLGLIGSILEETQLVREVLALDEVIIGNVGSPAAYSNLARVMAIEAGLSFETKALTLNRNCGSGLEALSYGALKIASGEADLILAGGVESMSQIPYLINKEISDFFQELLKAKTFREKLMILGGLKLNHMMPIHALKLGLHDSLTDKNMGQLVEKMAREMGLKRDEMDMYAHYSHLKAVRAQKENLFDDEIVPITCGASMDRVLAKDMGPRADSSIDLLSKLKGAFSERKDGGLLTAGNSSSLADGGALLMLASSKALKRYNLKALARLVDVVFVGVDPFKMASHGPVAALKLLKERNPSQLPSLASLSKIEINEAFAAQVLANLQLIKSEMGEEISSEKINALGGALALGHPVGATGARMAVTLVHQLRREALRTHKKAYGALSLCIGGGQGGAALFESLEKEQE